MIRHIHFRAWFGRGRASRREAESDGRCGIRRLHLETLEDRSLLSGNAVAEVTDGGTVDVSGNDRVWTLDQDNTDVVQRQTADAGASYLSDGSVASAPISSVIGAGLDAADSVLEDLRPSMGGVITTITADDLPAKQPTTRLSDADRSIDALPLDGGMVDADSLIDDSSSVTQGGMVDITTPVGEYGELPDPFPEKAMQVRSELAKRPHTPSDSSAKPVVVEGVGGRSQAFELAMRTDSPVGRHHAQLPADPHAPFGSHSATPVRPATTRLPGDQAVPSGNDAAAADSAAAMDPRHEVMSRPLTFDVADTVKFVSDTGSHTGEKQTDVAGPHLRGPDSYPAEPVRIDGSATNLADHTVQTPDSTRDQRIVFTKEEDWSRGDFHWLTVNVHNGRQTYAIALVAAALVSLRSPGWYFPWCDERQTFWTPPPEPSKSGS